MNELEVRARIDDALRSYCRGIDRLHGPSVEAAFHPGAELVGYGGPPTTVEAFVPRALASLAAKYVATQHRIGNTLAAIDGDHAVVETYVQAFHVQETDGGRLLLTFNGRYIDRFEERGGQWRIARRELRNDWSHIEPMGEPMGGTWIPSGRGDVPDPVVG
jgi:hypothetical protein